MKCLVRVVPKLIYDQCAKVRGEQASHKWLMNIDDPNGQNGFIPFVHIYSVRTSVAHNVVVCLC